MQVSRVQIPLGPLYIMGNKKSHKEEKLRSNLIENIASLKRKNYLLIVEGDKDKKALEKIGLKNIFVINKTGVSLYSRIEEIKSMIGKKGKCVILTDFDKKGRKIYSIIKEELLKDGIKMDNSFRDLLIRQNISHVEGLATFLKNLEERE